MGIGKLACGKVPAFIMVRHNLLKLQTVKIYGHKFLPYGPVVAGTGLAKLEAQHPVPPDGVNFPQYLYPLSLRNVHIGFPAGRVSAVGDIRNQVQGKAHVGVPGRMDIYPQGYAVVVAPILGKVKFQRHAGLSSLLAAESVPGSTLSLQMLPVHQGDPLPERLYAVLAVLPRVNELRLSSAHFPSAFLLHIVHHHR